MNKQRIPSIIHCLSFIILLLTNITESRAQLTDISPYSRYGIGDIQNQNSVLNFSMGGTGVAYHNDANFPFFVNLKNPASYAYNFMPSFDSTQNVGIKMACFEAGLLNNNQQQTTEGQTAQSSNAGLGYVAMTFPISRHFGGAFGLTPYTTEGYNILIPGYVNYAAAPNTTPLYNQYQGSGGLNRVFAGVAYSPFKNLSVGVNASYLFGNLTNEEDIIFPSSSTTLSTQTTENATVHAFYLDYGLMYTLNLPANLQITFGATTSLAANINADYGLLTVGYFSGSTQTNVDTIQDTSRVGKMRLPLMQTFGITIKQGESWTFSADYTIQYWNQFSYFGLSENLSNSTTLGFGMQYVPSKSSDRNISYFKKIYYRAGFSTGKTYLDLNNTQLNDTYISLGFGFPIGIRRKVQPVNASILNIGVQFGQLGTASNDLIKEDYIKILFGFTFDDQWFIKRKFD